MKNVNFKSINPNKISVVFCDIGGVLLTNGWGHESRMAAAEKFNIDYPEMNSLNQFMFTVWETGKISIDDYLDSVVFYKKRNFSKDEFKEFMFGESKMLPDTFELMLNWKSINPGIQFFAINNEPRELNDYRINKFQLRKLFNGFISSCDVHLRKPDPEIYLLALNISKAPAAECIYFDDRRFLAEAAQKAGIKSFVFSDFKNFEHSLKMVNNE